MKMKTDFITNSSSCAFIFLGFEMKKNKISFIELIKKFFNDVDLENYTEDKYEELFYELVEKNSDFDILYDTEQGAPSDDIFLIGYDIMNISETNLQEEGIEISKYSKNLKQLQDKFGSTIPVKIYGLVKMC